VIYKGVDRKRGTADERVEHDPAVRVCMVNRVEGFSYGYLCIQLFFQFPYQAGFGRFTWFNLPSGEFPFASQFGSLLPTEGQNFLPVLQDSAGYQERFSIHREVMIGSLSEKSKEPGCTPDLHPVFKERQWDLAELTR
jgi:hypothetical protein